MMKSLFSILILMLAVVGAKAQCALSTSIPTESNGDWAVQISLSNPGVKVTSIQFDLTIPSDFSYTAGNYLFSSRATTTRLGKEVDTHTLVSNSVKQGGTVRVIIYSNDNAIIKEESGVLVSLLLEGSGTAHVAPCNLTNIVISQMDGGTVSNDAIYPQAEINNKDLSCYDCMDDDAFVIGSLTEAQAEEFKLCLATNPNLYLVDLSDCTNDSLGSLSITNTKAIVACNHKGQVDTNCNVLIRDGEYFTCERMNIYDGDGSFSLPFPTKIDTVCYYRTFNNTNWQALYLPFRLPIASLAESFDLAQLYNVTEEDDSYYLLIRSVKRGTLPANIPMLIRSKESGSHEIILHNIIADTTAITSVEYETTSAHFTIEGTYSSIMDMYDKGYYAMGGGSLIQAASSLDHLGPFRWYMKMEEKSANAASKRITISWDETFSETGIESISSQSNADLKYDLYGRIRTKTAKTHYITKGRISLSK